VSYLLDTTVVSEMAKPPVNEGVARFLSGTDEDELYLSVLTLGELRYGIERLTAGAERSRLERWYEEDLLGRFERRIFLVDGFAAAEWGRVKSRGERSGQPISDMDAWIAATAIIHGLTVVTRNVGDFSGCGGELLNPWV
jgi:predicted nucleic acid-binding protein